MTGYTTVPVPGVAFSFNHQSPVGLIVSDWTNQRVLARPALVLEYISLTCSQH